MSAILSACLILPAVAGEVLKLEVLVPKEPFVISKNKLDEAAAEAAKVLKARLGAPELDGKVDPEERKRQLVNQLQNLQQQKPPIQQGISLIYRITNISDQDLEMEHGGDTVTNTLVVKGPGALDVPYQGPMTLDFRGGSPYTLKAGASREFVIGDLAYGRRDMSCWLITKPGDYEVTLSHKIIAMNGLRAELKSNTAKFSVVEK